MQCDQCNVPNTMQYNLGNATCKMQCHKSNMTNVLWQLGYDKLDVTTIIQWNVMNSMWQTKWDNFNMVNAMWQIQCDKRIVTNTNEISKIPQRGIYGHCM